MEVRGRHASRLRNRRGVLAGFPGAILEPGELLAESQRYFPDRAVALLGDDEFRLTLNLAPLIVIDSVVFRAHQ